MNKVIRYLIIAGVLVVVLLVIIYIVYQNYQKNDGVNLTPNNQHPTLSDNKSETQSDVPENVSVPEQNQQINQDIAAPVNVVPTSPQSNTSLRKFEIKAEGNIFKPKEIIVYSGDIIQVKITAVDKNYDWVQPDYGLNVKIPKGGTKSIDFQATTPGKFAFYCDSCGGLKSTAVGYVIVVPKK